MFRRVPASLLFAAFHRIAPRLYDKLAIQAQTILDNRGIQVRV